jgi:tetratricopeptide (TPR) repeat protein
MQPIPYSEDENLSLSHLQHVIERFGDLAPEEQDMTIKKLEIYECYHQAIQLIQWRIKNYKNSKRLFDIIWIFRIYYFGIQNFESFLESVEKFVKEFKITFSLIRMHVADDIIGTSNYPRRARLFETLLNSLHNQDDKELCLEFLGHIYSKKLHQEDKAIEAFHKILEIKDKNLKALNFFKMYCLKNNYPQNAAEHLNNYLEACPNALEKQRAAHELAQIYLYNLNEPEKAKYFLLEYCANLPINILEDLFESLEKLKEYDFLLKYIESHSVLKELINDSPPIQYRIGLVHMKVGNIPKAIEYFKTASSYSHNSLLPWEGLIMAAIEDKNTPLLKETLENLKSKIQNIENLKEVSDLIESLPKIP